MHGMQRRAAAGIAVLGVCALAIGIERARADHPSGIFGTGGGPINTISAGTMEQGGVAVSFRLDYLDFKRFSDAQLLALDAQGIDTDSIDYSIGAFLSAAYGVTNNFTVAVRLPYLHFDDIREVESGDVETEGDSSGLGDALLLGFYRFYNDTETKLQASMIFGLEVPSGRTHNRSLEGDLLEVEHQPGSGSWDPLVGLAVSHSFHKLSFHMSGTYQFNTLGSQDTRLGDIATYNAALVWRPWEHEHEHDHGDHDHGDYHDHGHDHSHAASRAAAARNRLVSYHDEDHDHAHYGEECGCGCGCGGHHPWILDLMLEINGVWQDFNNIAGDNDPNSGGNVTYASPGMRITFNDHWSTFVTVGIPIAEHLYGVQHAPDWRLASGVTWVY